MDDTILVYMDRVVKFGFNFGEFPGFNLRFSSRLKLNLIV